MKKLTIKNRNGKTQIMTEIPDIWHVAEELQENGRNDIGVQVAHVWGLCHALKYQLERAYSREPNIFGRVFDDGIKVSDVRLAGEKDNDSDQSGRKHERDKINATIKKGLTQTKATRATPDVEKTNSKTSGRPKFEIEM